MTHQSSSSGASLGKVTHANHHRRRFISGKTQSICRPRLSGSRLIFNEYSKAYTIRMFKKANVFFRLQFLYDFPTSHAMLKIEKC